MTDTGDRRVLHVIESYGGGVASSLARYVHNTPEIEHHLLAHVRDGDFADSGEFTAFASVRALTPSLRPARHEIRAAIRDVAPHVVHAHSSFGGAYVRLAVRAGRRPTVVYTPHGFGFERRDLGRLQRFAFHAAEVLLAANTSVVAACAPREAASAKRMLARRVVYVPNVATVSRGELPVRDPRAVVALGRIAPQRDPDFYLAFARRLSALDPSARLIWIGGGDPAYEARLREAGVVVTGWLPHAEAIGRLASGAIYVHTAAWDGFPMSILEAHRLGLAVAARRVSALPDLPQDLRTPGVLAEHVHSLLQDPDRREAARAEWERYLDLNTDESQRRALLHAYGVTTTGRSR